MNPELAAALARMNDALARLDAAVARHLDTDGRRSDLEVELQVMGDDRMRLAGELDSATARIAQLEATADQVELRLGTAIGSIQDILASELRTPAGA